MKCSICGKEIVGHGNSAFPVTMLKCCDECNLKVVIPARVFMANIDRYDYAMLILKDEIKLVKPDNKYFTLKELQKAVDGYIEVVSSNYPFYVEVVNEEGLLKKLPYNNITNLLLGKEYVGNVLLCPVKIFEKPEEE